MKVARIGVQKTRAGRFSVRVFYEDRSFTNLYFDTIEEAFECIRARLTQEEAV